MVHERRVIVIRYGAGCITFARGGLYVHDDARRVASGAPPRRNVVSRAFAIERVDVFDSRASLRLAADTVSTVFFL